MAFCCAYMETEIKGLPLPSRLQVPHAYIRYMNIHISLNGIILADFSYISDTQNSCKDSETFWPYIRNKEEKQKKERRNLL